MGLRPAGEVLDAQIPPTLNSTDEPQLLAAGKTLARPSTSRRASSWRRTTWPVRSEDRRRTGNHRIPDQRSSFGYNYPVADSDLIPIMQELGYPVVPRRRTRQRAWHLQQVTRPAARPGSSPDLRAPGSRRVPTHLSSRRTRIRPTPSATPPRSCRSIAWRRCSREAMELAALVRRARRIQPDRFRVLPGAALIQVFGLHYVAKRRPRCGSNP